MQLATALPPNSRAAPGAGRPLGRGDARSGDALSAAEGAPAAWLGESPDDARLLGGMPTTLLRPLSTLYPGSARPSSHLLGSER